MSEPTPAALLDEMVDELEDPDRFERVIELTEALVASGDRSLVPALTTHLDAALDDGNFFARDMFSEVLAAVGGMDTLPVLLRASARDLDDDQDSMWMTVTELAESDRDAARAILLPLITSPSTSPGDTTGEPDLRRIAIALLDFVEEPGDLPLLIAATRDIDPRVRSAALGAIGGDLVAAHEDAFAAVLAALDDPEPSVRIAALWTLESSSRQEVSDRIRQMLQDPDPKVRRRAEDTLEQIATNPAPTTPDRRS